MRDASCPSCQSRITLDAQEQRTGQVQCPTCFESFAVAPSAVAEDEGYRLAGSATSADDEDASSDMADDPEIAAAPPLKPRRKKSDPRQGGGRKSANRKAPVKSGRSIPPQLLIVGGAGAAGLLILLVIIVLFVFRGGDDQPENVAANGGAAGDAAAADLTEVGAVQAKLDLSRQPQPGPQSWVPAGGPTSADPGQWQVAADPAPAPGEIRTLVSMPPDPGVTIYGFAVQPTAGQWGLLVSETWKTADGEDAKGVKWRRYRFSDAAPFEEVLLVLDKEAEDRATQTTDRRAVRRDPNALDAEDHATQTTDRVALSPSGNRVALPAVRNKYEDHSTIEVWDNTGARVGSFVLENLGTRDEMACWLQFGSEDRVWVCIGKKGNANQDWDPYGRLALWNAVTGEQILQIPETVHGHPGMSPGGKYIACILDDRISVRTAADGQEVGVIPTVANFVYGGVDFHPSGKSLAAVIGDGAGDQYVSVWSLPDGKQTDRFFRKTSGAESNIGGVRWLGDRVLGLLDGNYLSGGEILDLDLHAVVCEFNLPKGVSLQRGMPAPQPRLWHIREFHPSELPALGDKLVQPPNGWPAMALTVASLPEEYTGVLEKARNGGVLWHPGAPCGLTIVGSVIDDQKMMNDERRASLLRATADRTAKLGYRLDDQAPLTLELTLKSVKYIGGGDYIDHMGSTRIVKGGKGVVRSKEVLGKGLVLDLVRDGAEPRLPSLLLRDAQLNRIYLPTWFNFGVDGELPAEVTLPEDRPDFHYGPQDVD